MTEEAAPSRASSAQDTNESSPKPPAGTDMYIGTEDYLQSLVVTIILALFATTFLVQAFKIPSASMSPALLVGDHLLVNKFVFAGADDAGKWYDRILPYRVIRRGDVVVFKYPYENHPYYVKRIIGVPGDHVRIAGQRVFVNGSELNEPYAVHDPMRADPYMFDFPPKSVNDVSGEIPAGWANFLRHNVQHGEIVVPADHYFVLGDNRDNSSDSRYWGFVPRDAIVGSPIFVYWSLRPPREALPQANSRAQNFENLFKRLLGLPHRTRWNRTLHEVH
ncbi:MAG TPA: signal peptidase I [Verrucomicrobiae bacterium]|nr:signal peptidase I [Verrucomicrobiae bacterium]